MAAAAPPHPTEATLRRATAATTHHPLLPSGQADLPFRESSWAPPPTPTSATATPRPAGSRPARRWGGGAAAAAAANQCGACTVIGQALLCLPPPRAGRCDPRREVRWAPGWCWAECAARPRPLHASALQPGQPTGVPRRASAAPLRRRAALRAGGVRGEEGGHRGAEVSCRAWPAGGAAQLRAHVPSSSRGCSPAPPRPTPAGSRCSPTPRRPPTTRCPTPRTWRPAATPEEGGAD